VSSDHLVVFLIDVDNTLLDNDLIQQDFKDHLEHVFGFAARERYWKILDELFVELGFRDYIGALERYRGESPHQVELLSMSSFLLDYPFADRLFPAALEVLQLLGRLARTVILSDGDIVFQPRKIEHAGLSDAVGGRVLIYIHKEKALDDVERRYPATFLWTTSRTSWQPQSDFGARGRRRCSSGREPMPTIRAWSAPPRRRT